MIKTIIAIGALVVGVAANAAIIHTTTTPAGAVALTGSTVVDFESFAPAEYAGVTSMGLTITPDNGHQFIDTDYASSYNNFGKLSLHNCYCGDSFGGITGTFASTVSKFGFFFGASDTMWTLSTFDALGGLIDSADIGPTHGSNAGDFYYTLSGPIKSWTLTGVAGDYIFIDNISFPGAAGVPEASTWAMLVAGFGLVGAASRRRRHTIVAA